MGIGGPWSGLGGPERDSETGLGTTDMRHRRARAFRAFTVKAHFVVHSNFIVHSEAKKRREERGKKEKRGKPNKTNIDAEIVIVSDFYGIDKPSLVSIRGSVC